MWKCILFLSLLSALPGWAAKAFQFSDDFRGYAAGSDGAPGWETETIDWAMGTGAFTYHGAERDFALPGKAPLGTAVTVTATLTLQEAVGAGWKVAGVCVRQNAQNFWHLAFVEGPDADGKHHFVELSEMRNGVWNAHLEAATRLTPRADNNGNFAWQYHHPYLCTLAMTADGISGTVCEADGTADARLGFAFDGKAVTNGRPGLSAAGLATDYAAFSSNVDGAVAAPPAVVLPPYPLRGGTLRGKATGYFHVEQVQQAWWFIDPRGVAMVDLGVDHVNYQAHWCEKLGYAPYHRNCEQRYGGEAGWAAHALERLQQWGFTSLGVGSSDSVRYRRLPHQLLLGLGTEFSNYDAITPKTTWTGFPDVFSPNFSVFCVKRARQLCTPDDPWLLGYFIDNELEWQQWTGKGIMGDTMAKAADHPAKQALTALLQARYPQIEAFNTAWGTHLTDWPALGRLTALPVTAGVAAKADERAFIRLCAERYFAVTTDAIRQVDAHHLILGCRFAGQAPDVLDIAGKYCDVLSINCYRQLDLTTGEMTDGFPDELAHWHDAAQRPMMITEWSFPALDVGLPCLHGAGQRVPTQRNRAFAFTHFQRLLLATPYVVGSNYFMWADEPALGISSTFPEDSNYGLVNEKDDSYPLLTDAAARLHRLAESVHAGKMAQLAITVAMSPTGDDAITLQNTGGGAAMGTLEYAVDGRRTTKPITVPAHGRLACPVSTRTQPGGHALLCRFIPDEALLVAGTLHGVALHYTPGLAPTLRHVPVMVANPSAEALEQVVVSLPSPFPAGPVSAVDSITNAEIPCQLDTLSGGAEVALRFEHLQPYEQRTVLLLQRASALPPIIPCTPQGVHYTLDNGVLSLTKTGEDGMVCDTLSLQGTEMGSYTPLFWQVVAGNRWVAPECTAQVTVFSGPARTVLEVVGRADGNGARHFRAATRLEVTPAHPWVRTRLLWVENTDTAPLPLHAYYHYLRANLGGQHAEVVARTDHWVGPGDAALGVVGFDKAYTFQFYLDENGGQHPDAQRLLDVTLAPGARCDQPQPPLYLAAGNGQRWDTLRNLIALHDQVIVQAFPAEGQ